MTQKYIHNNRFHDLFMRFLVWREHHISERTFLIFLALLVGVFGGWRLSCLSSSYTPYRER